MWASSWWNLRTRVSPLSAPLFSFLHGAGMCLNVNPKKDTNVPKLKQKIAIT
jgi:hypothetical protein